MTGRDALLAAAALEFAYRAGGKVLHGVAVEAVAGEFLCLLGPNGSGKTTLLRCLLGDLVPSAGHVLLEGRPLQGFTARERARRLAYVPQQPLCAFTFTVEEIVLMGRYAHMGALNLAGPKDRDIAREAMKMTGTLEFLGRTLAELSGGEAQRVMIARALAQQPSVCLLDEPTSHLDIAQQMRIYRMMRRLAHDWRMAVICVSHDVNLAARFADRLVLLRDGRIVAVGRPEEVISAEELRRTYDVAVDLIPVDDGPPLVRPKEPPEGDGGPLSG